MGNSSSIDKEFLEPRLLSQLVSYQDGAIVSRTVINKGAGTVTVFAFDEGQSLSPHTAPFDALVVALEGSLALKIGDREHLLKKDEAVIMPAGIPHGVSAAEKFKMMLVMIKAAE